MHSNVVFLFVTLYLFATATALAIPRTAPKSSNSYRSVSSIADHVYHTLAAKSIVEALPVAKEPREVLVARASIVERTSSDIERRTKQPGGGWGKRDPTKQPGGGWGKRDPKALEARTKQPGGGWGKRLIDTVSRRTKQPGGGWGKRKSDDLEARTKTPKGGWGKRSPDDLEKRTKQPGGGWGRRSIRDAA